MKHGQGLRQGGRHLRDMSREETQRHRGGAEVAEFSHHFRAMGTEVAMWVWNDNEQRARGALLAAERFFAQTEARLSRFRPDSELSRLNRAAGRPFVASRLLYALVESALVWRRRTGGIFDPTILNALLAAGYDRPFAAIQAEQAAEHSAAAAGGGAGDEFATQAAAQVTAEAIQLGPQQQIILPSGLRLDLGGIAKGWAVQQAAQRLGMWGACLVDAGGDIAAVGAPPAQSWVVSVADPQLPEQEIAVLGLRNEAVATSSRAHRQWRHAGRPAHHLIDPSTGAPAETTILSATVVAPRLPDAEIYAKTALILGETAGLAYLHQIPGISAILVTEDGRHLMSGEFEKKAYVSSSNFTERFRIPA